MAIRNERDGREGMEAADVGDRAGTDTSIPQALAHAEEMPDAGQLAAYEGVSPSRLMMIAYFMHEPLYRRAFDMICETDPVRLEKLLREMERHEAA